MWYDNYDAINVDHMKDIPCDYYGTMSVSITFMNYYCPEQFEIRGITIGNTVGYGMMRLCANAVQYNCDGSVQGGGKVNTADGVDGYLLAVLLM